MFMYLKTPFNGSLSAIIGGPVVYDDEVSTTSEGSSESYSDERVLTSCKFINFRHYYYMQFYSCLFPLVVVLSNLLPIYFLIAFQFSSFLFIKGICRDQSLKKETNPHFLCRIVSDYFLKLFRKFSFYVFLYLMILQCFYMFDQYYNAYN